MRRKLLFLLVDALMKLWDDIVRLENVLIRLRKYFEDIFSFIKKVFQKITSLQNKFYEKEQWELNERISLEEKSKEFEIDESFLIDERAYYEPDLLIYEPSEEIKEAEEESIRSSLLDQFVMKEEMADYNNELRFKRDYNQNLINNKNFSICTYLRQICITCVTAFCFSLKLICYRLEIFF